MYTTNALARYSFAVEPERAYSLEVSATGYDAVNDSFSTPELKGSDVSLERNLYVRRIEIPVSDEVPEIENIYFDFDKAGLRETAKEELDLVAEILQNNENLSLEILAHTDWYGTYFYNVDLSEKRADAARKYLLSKGLSSDRLQTAWFSENVPLETNENNLGRQYNRRCEFKFIGGNGNVVLSSRRLKKGAEAPYVDNAIPKGKPGLDNPDARPMATASSKPMSGGIASGNPGTQISSGVVNYYPKAGNAISSSSNGTTANTPAGLENVKLRNVYFDFDRSEVKRQAEPELDRIVDILASNPDYKLIIKGHTDSQGTDTYNQNLSVKRCQGVYDYLVSIGVPETRLSFSGFSENSPIADNSTATGRQYNRRVEFEIRLGSNVVLNSVK
jgi:outer membrane protein OmpA-like peptidoglycan-associated protein